MKPLLLGLALALAAGCAGHSTVVVNDTTPTTEADTEPPAPQAEPVIERPGYFWIKGRWSWRSNQWNWLGGHWEKERGDQHWEPGHWDRHGSGWHWTEGRWQKAS